MSNVLDDDKQQQILALGRLGWSLRRIEQALARPSRDHQRLSESRRHRGAVAAAGGANRKQNRPFPRRCPPTSGQNRPLRARGVHRPGASATAGPSPERERLRAVSRDHRRGAGAWAQRRRHLAGPGRRPRLSRALRECPPLRRGPARPRSGGRARRHHDGARRRRPGRLRRGADGPRPRHRASTDARASSS